MHPLQPACHPTLLAVAGPSGSGKTTLARELAHQLAATLFPLDLYYRDLAHLPLEAREHRNFDHPDALESELFLAHLQALSRGQPIQRPVYDFATHARVPGAFTTVTPAPFVLVEGILALHFPELRRLYRFSVFVDTPEPICLARRIHRDIRERGRTEASIRTQWAATAQPMAERFVLPSQRNATLTVSGIESLDWSVELIRRALRERGLL